MAIIDMLGDSIGLPLWIRDRFRLAIIFWALIVITAVLWIRDRFRLAIMHGARMSSRH